MRKLIDSIKTVFSNKHYVILFISIALIFYIINALIIQWPNKHLFTLTNSISLLTTGFYYLITRTTFYSTIIISFLTGILISLLFYKSKNFSNSSSTKILSSFGIFLGALVPGCAACGIGLSAILGLSSSLFYLPFKGAEISILAILILLFAVYKTSITLFECRLKKFQEINTVNYLWSPLQLKWLSL